ncbi:MAG: hypothetical protein JWR75_1023 [Devosia sp.]|nr:hypothetical protein [Devosia sp.]
MLVSLFERVGRSLVIAEAGILVASDREMGEAAGRNRFQAFRSHPPATTATRAKLLIMAKPNQRHSAVSLGQF